MAGQRRTGKDSGWVLGVISHSPVTWAHHRISGVGTVDRVGKSERWMNGRSHTTPFSFLHLKSDIIAGSLPSLSLWRRVRSFINPGLLPPHRMMQRFAENRPPDQKIKDSMLSNNTAINSPLEFQSGPGWSQQYPIMRSSFWCQHFWTHVFHLSQIQDDLNYISSWFCIYKHHSVDTFQEHKDHFACLEKVVGEKKGNIN